MIFYNVASSQKIVHSASCPCICHKDLAVVRAFEDYNHAQKYGYRCCKLCHPLSRSYSREAKEIDCLCKPQVMEVKLLPEYIEIVSRYDDWRLLLDDLSGKFSLYHKNTMKKKTKKESPIKGYHLQGKTFGTIVEYLRYIEEHDWYRMTHPERQGKSKPPKQYTHRYNKMQKHLRRSEAYAAANRVLYLIDQLSLQPTHA